MSHTCTCESKADIYLPTMATVVKSEPMTDLENFLSFKMDSGEELGHQPGQFAELSVLGIGEAPISVSSSPTREGTFEMVVRNVGNVSNAIHALKSGDKVGIRGPFGTTFPVNDEMKGKDILFICGGIGLVPVRSAIQYVLDHRADYGKVTILFGTKSPADRLFVKELEEWGKAENVSVLETVDHGDESWAGNQGVITTLIPLIDHDSANTVAIVCGPPIMYKFVIIELRNLGMSDESIFVSLERHMKCGVGKCGHCQINDIYVCQDGPVFKLSDITDIEEAL